MPAVNGNIRFARNSLEKYSEACELPRVNFITGFASFGKKLLIKIKTFTGFAQDGKSFTVEIEPLQPNKHYQLVIGSGFRDKSGMSLRSYAIDITTEHN